MPLTYDVDESRNAIHVRLSGVVSDEDIVKGSQSILADPRVRPGYTMLYDASGADVRQVSAAVIDNLNQSNAKHADKTVDARVAIVLPGFHTEMADEYSRRANHSVIVFCTMEVARAWLGWEPGRTQQAGT